mgnify:CR=1 FL=1
MSQQSMADITKMFGTSGQPARPNLFKVKIPYMGKEFEYKVRAASMPGAQVEPVKLNYLNRQFNVAGDRIYEDWTTTIFLDENHEVREQLIAWQNLCHSMGIEIHGEVPVMYKKSGTCTQYSRDGVNETASADFTGIWPSNIGPVEYDWDTKSEVAYFEVTWTYDWWEPRK